MKCLICGMDININNFNINSKGLLEDNESECVKYCPFCGVNTKYIKVENEEIFDARVKRLDPSTLVILDHAMKLEIFNSDFYKAAAVLASSVEVKETFEALSKIERMHAIVHMKLGGFKELPKLVNIDYSKHKTDKSLMNLAEDREIHASQFYEKKLKKIVDPNVKEVFIALSQVERDHIKIAENN
ncbi:MAG: ferritin family protein [Clostridiaceae bacterium]|nr:ferritin family protein [Clostridiaceae bacterium]